MDVVVVVVVVVDRFYIKQQQKRSKRRFVSLFSVCFFQVKKLFPDANLRLPGKKFFGNLDPEFIQQRREGLDEFIHNLVSHPQLCQQ